MELTTNAGVAFHSRSYGLTRMPAFANLAAVTHFRRTLPCVSGRLLSAPVSSLSSFATKCSQLGDFQSEGRASSPTLPVAQSRRPAQLHIDVNLVENNKGLVADESPSTRYLSSSNPRGSAYPTIRETSHTTTRNPPQQNPKYHTPSPPNLRLKSAVNADSSHRRTHTIAYGKLIPVIFRSGSLESDDKVPASHQKMLTIPTMAAGARPLLHTAQGFPFDMRRSRVEAGRVDGAPLESF